MRYLKIALVAVVVFVVMAQLVKRVAFIRTLAPLQPTA